MPNMERAGKRRRVLSLVSQSHTKFLGVSVSAFSIEVQRVESPDAAAIWAQLCRWRVARAMLWDVAESQRQGVFSSVLDVADIYEARSGGVPVAYAWIVPVATDIPVATAHFCGRSYDETSAAGRELVSLIQAEGYYRSLLGVIPWPYRHARRLVRELGFHEMRVPGMCNLSRGRVVPGALVVREL